MRLPRATRLFSSLALAAVLTAAGAPVLAACPGLVACPMAAAMPSPPPCHGEASMPRHEPAPLRLAADDCCVQAPPALPVAVPESRAPLAPEAPAVPQAGSALHPAGTPEMPRAVAEIDAGPLIPACERLSLLQTFLI